MTGEELVKDEGAFYRELPKVELHRHLEGSLRLETLQEIAREYGITLPIKHGLGPLVQMQSDDPYDFATFLSKFATIRLFYRSPEIIARVTDEAIADAAADNIRHLELLFTPVALSRAQGFSLGEVMDWVAEAAAAAGRKYGVNVLLLASVNRHEPVHLAEETVLEAASRIERGIVGVNLAGNEVEFSAKPFAGVFAAARQAGLHVTIHAGEWTDAENVREAIEELGAERIGHGVRVLEDPAVMRLAAERGTTFEVCLTSNYQTGSVANLSVHPFKQMLDAGLKVTLNTDDPSISQITLSDEYQLACEKLHLSKTVLAGLVLEAVRASFLPGAQKETLIQKFQTEMAHFQN